MANNAVTYTREQRNHATTTQTPLITIDYDDRHVVYETTKSGRVTFQGPPDSPSLATTLRLLRELLQTHCPTSPALAELASPPEPCLPLPPDFKLVEEQPRSNPNSSVRNVCVSRRP